MSEKKRRDENGLSTDVLHKSREPQTPGRNIKP